MQRVGAWGRLLNCSVLIWPCEVYVRVPSSCQVSECISGRDWVKGSGNKWHVGYLVRNVCA